MMEMGQFDEFQETAYERLMKRGNAIKITLVIIDWTPRRFPCFGHCQHCQKHPPRLQSDEVFCTQ